MKQIDYTPMILALVNFARENLKKEKLLRTFREHMSRANFLKEFATVRIGGPRRSGHTFSAMKLWKDPEANPMCIVPYDSMIQSWQDKDSYPTTIDNFVDQDTHHHYHGRLIIVDCATVDGKKLDRVYDTLGKFLSVPDDLVVVLLQ